MSRRWTLKSRLIFAGGAVFGLVALLGLVALYTLQTAWFKDRVRERIISSVETATGGRVELGSFNYDWHTLTADLNRFVVHGMEPSGAPPLFQAQSVHLGIRVISLIKRDVDISTLAVERPEIYLLVQPDGTTNIPSPRMRQSTAHTVEELLNLKLRHVEFNHGLIQAEMRRVPLNVRGENVSVLVDYDRTRPRYNARISSKDITFDSDAVPRFSVSLDATAQLERNRLVIQQLALASKASKLQVAGTVQSFAHPNIDLSLDGRLEFSDIFKRTQLAALRGGHLELRGRAHYDESADWMLEGKLGGRNLIFRSNSFNLTNAYFDSNVIANREEVRFTRVSFTALNSQFAGDAVLKGFRDLQLEGRLSALDLRQVGTFLFHRALPWSGMASGPVHLHAFLIGQTPDFALRGDLQITPAREGIPVSGNVDVSYAKRGDVIQFGNSRLQFPATQLMFSGALGTDLQLTFDSTNLDDLKPALAFSTWPIKMSELPVLVAKGRAHFDGAIIGPFANPRIQGSFALAHFRLQGAAWDEARSLVDVAMSGADFSSLRLDQGSFHASGRAHVGLKNWQITPRNQIRLDVQFTGANIAQMMTQYLTLKMPIATGVASGSVNLSGSLDDPSGNAQITMENLDTYGERVNQLQLAATVAAGQIRVTRGRMQAGQAQISFSGMYTRAHDTWRSGQIELKVDSNEFPFANLGPVRKYEPGLSAQFEIHAEAAARISGDHVEPTFANGTVSFRQVAVNKVPYGSLSINGTTRGNLLTATIAGDLRDSHLTGSAEVQLVPGTPAKGEMQLGRVQFGTLYSLLNPGENKTLPIDGFVQGGIAFEGALEKPDQLRATMQIQNVELDSTLPAEATAQVKTADLIFRNVGSIVLEAANGVAVVRSFRIAGKDTSLSVSGSIPYAQQRPLNLSVNGSVDLRIFQLFDPNVLSSGQSLVAASIGGTITKPSVDGTLELRNGSFFLNNVANGLSAVNGTVRFDRGRATIQKLTAKTGGGELSLTGFASFGAGRPAVYRLEANADNVRVRYAGGISVTASSELRLTGTSENGLLSGNISVSRVVLNPSTDVGTVLASIGAPVASPSNEKAFLGGLQLDVRVESAPNLQLSTALSRDVEAEIDLRLRGTPDHPVLLGSVAANQGDIKVFGTKYSINRGEVSFSNPVKIEPVLDLDLETEARGIVVDVTVSGTLGKLNINYRSDPPLQPRDIIALLTVGRAPNTVSDIPNATVTNDVSALQSGANTVLGQAISPVSNRLSKLFGITNIKIDPLVQGITNTPQARLTIEQQISREITVTYVTNLSQTSEQIFRLEYALSPQYSLVALRDDNGEFGIDIQYKKRFK